MSDIETEIKGLKLKIEEARRVKTRADLQRDSARATVDKIASRLKLEFGVNSLTEAQQLLESVDDDLRGKVGQIQDELHAFE